MSRICFAVFADLHHAPRVFYTQALQRLKAIQQNALKSQAKCLISLGDFCHFPDQSQDILNIFHGFELPSYHVLGNHDTDHCALAMVRELYKMPSDYYFFDIDGFRFVVIDSNFVQTTDAFEHFEFRNYNNYPQSRETIPGHQLVWLKQTLMDSPYPCILLSHASIERESTAGIVNQQELIKIIREANIASPGKVIMSINGHHHRDFLRILENVAYLDLNSASFDWVNNSHDFYPKELTEEYEYVKHTVVYNEPLHAIITISEDRTIEIRGMTGSMFMNVTREMTDNPKCDAAGRPCTPNVLSATIKLSK